MLRLKSSFLHFINVYRSQFNFVGWKITSWRKIEGRPIIKTTTTTTTTYPPWDLLPHDILPTIFKDLCVGDRVRARLVCKSWKQILTTKEYNIPKMPEAPWQILSNDSYNKPESCVKEIQFTSLLEERTYRFQLPLSIGNDQLERGWWLCGSSRGWLLIVVGPILNPDMFLWQPLTGDTRKLPPMSTLPYSNEFIELGNTGVLETLSSAIHRVEVFSMGSTECIVAVVFKRDTCREIALCTPQEKTWKVFGGGDNIKLRYSDILFHSTDTKLYALATRKTSPSPDALDNFLSNNKEIVLTDCQIPVHIIFMQNNENLVRDRFPLGLQLAHPQKHIMHLVESPLSHNVLIVSTVLDCFANEVINNPIARFRCQQTTRLSVTTFAGDVLSSVGEKETIFLGSAGSFSIPTVEGVEADCIYFAIDDALGAVLNGGAKRYVIREHGVFSLQQNKMLHVSVTNLKFPCRSKVGWFMPQL